MPIDKKLQNIVTMCYEIYDTTLNVNTTSKHYKDFVTGNIDKILWELGDIEVEMRRNRLIK